MPDQQLTDLPGFVVQHPVGGILECDQVAILAQIYAEGSHFVAEMGVLLSPEDERWHPDLGGCC